MRIKSLVGVSIISVALISCSDLSSVRGDVARFHDASQARCRWSSPNHVLLRSDLMTAPIDQLAKIHIDLDPPKVALTANAVSEDLHCLQLIFEQVYAGIEYYDSKIKLREKLENSRLSVNSVMSAPALLDRIFAIHDGAYDAHLSYSLGGPDAKSRLFSEMKVFVVTIPFSRNTNGTFTAIPSTELKIQSCTGMRPVRLMAQGAWMFLGQAITVPHDVKCSKVSGESVTINDVTELSPANPNLPDFQFSKFPSRVSYLRISTMPHELNSEINTTLQEIANPATESTLVIDLRHNGGGDGEFALQLERALKTRAENMTAIETTDKLSQLSAAGFLNTFFMKIAEAHDSGSVLNEINGFKSVRNWATEVNKLGSWGVVKISQNPSVSETGLRSAPRTKPVVLLFDKRCASACEDVLDRLRTHPRAIFVGTPSFGAGHLSNAGFFLLPNSKIVARLGFHRTIYQSDIETQEMIGHLPDFLAYDSNPTDLLKSVLNFAQSL